MSKKKGKKARPTIPGLSRESSVFREELQRQTDRGAALVGTAYLEEALAAMLRAFMIDEAAIVEPLFEYSKPLSTLAARVEVAYALGLLGKQMHADLNTIRKIRNEFAHSYKPATFCDLSIRTLCENLGTMRWDQTRFTPTPGDRFIIAVVLLAHQLVMRAMSLTHASVGKDYKWQEDITERPPQRSRASLPSNSVL